MSDLSTLGYALLGLLQQRPLSGYDLRKLFAATPLRSFSDSPGAIYPALRRLEERHFIRSKVESAGLRQRRMFRPTPAGIAAFKKWQTRKVSQKDIVRRADELMLRFAFMDQTAGPDEALRFLKEFASELAAYTASLRTYHSGAEGMATSGRLALESGIQRYETLLRWARRSIAVYQRGRMKAVKQGGTSS